MLKIDDLIVTYGLAQAVRGISLTVASGEIVGILGRNGAGKTTLLRAISGLIPVVAGSMHLDNQNITNNRADHVARHGIGHVLEDRGVFGDLTVGENLRASFTGISKQAEEKRLASIFELFPWLKERQKQLGGNLSGGQQQMLAIARALLRRPKILLLDEPSKGLAPSVVESVAAVLRKAVVETGMGVLLVEQSFDLLWSLSDRIYVLSEGRIILEGQKASLSPDQLRAAYFGDASSSAPVSGPGAVS